MNTMKLIALIALVPVFIMGALGVAYSYHLMSHEGMGMSGCPTLHGTAALCPMGPLAHLNAWQMQFAAIPAEKAIPLIAFSYVSLLCIQFWQQFVRSHAPPRPMRTLLAARIASADSLSHFIARGLMHPKLFHVPN